LRRIPAYLTDNLCFREFEGVFIDYSEYAPLSFIIPIFCPDTFGCLPNVPPDFSNMHTQLVIEWAQVPINFPPTIEALSGALRCIEWVTQRQAM